MVLPFNHHLKTKLRRWLLGRDYLDESPSWYQSQKSTTMDTPQSPTTILPAGSHPPALESDAHSDASSSLQSYVTPMDMTDDVAPDVILSTSNISAITPANTATPEEARMAVTWPPGEIPVELFEIITSYLSRAEVKTLRLVCWEFESKVSARYFKNVVVPFRSELYGSLPYDEFGTRKCPSSALFSNGMRIFESFGRHIRRFALSLEIDEDALAHPPIKPAQAAVPSFWGVYRWPHQTYNRYSDLQGIEQTADETEGMTKALRCLTRVTNFGLCCDAGLGFLVHPDTVARTTNVQHPVFATQDWRREHRAARVLNEDDNVVTIADFNGLTAPRRKSWGGDPLQLKRSILEKMAVDAGFADSQIDEAIDLLLETEGTSMPSIDFDERQVSVMRVVERRNSQRRGDLDYDTVLSTQWHTFGSSEEDRHGRAFPLVPANLTRAQKELLLELEWAHRAMIQSFVISMTDNASLGFFNHLTTLTIAKIPSSHVHILCRDDFWDSFPNLTNLSLGVIPDWRRISKPAPGCIEDEPVSPIAAVTKVFKLLHNYVGTQAGIESLHFEWICGGEFAPSSYQRQQFIVPAPFLEDPDLMTLPAGAALGRDRLLSLPHIKHLSLKNCWASPHVMLQTIRQMALSSLEKLEFESVSLSGQPTTNAQFPLGQQQVVQAPAGLNGGPNLNHMMLHNGFVGPAHQAHLIPPPQLHNAAEDDPEDVGMPQPQPPTMPSQNHPPDSLQTPEWLTWAGILEHFSPGTKIHQILDGEDETRLGPPRSVWAENLRLIDPYLPRSDRLILEERRHKLKCLSFKSCGYVSIDAHHINTRGLLPPGAQAIIIPSNPRLMPPRLMQYCKDKLLGQILPFIHLQEAFNLTTAFHMEMGWDSVYDEKVIDEAITDGVDFPGMGRFSGLVEASCPGDWTGYLSDSEGSDGMGDSP